MQANRGDGPYGNSFRLLAAAIDGRRDDPNETAP